VIENICLILRQTKDFSGKDAINVALSTDAIPIRERNTRIPRRLAEVIDTALRERPAIGIQSALELKKEIVAAS
jgi:Mor family transcriptional regulator